MKVDAQYVVLREVIIPSWHANLYSFVLFLIMVLIGLMFSSAHQLVSTFRTFMTAYVVWIPAMLIGMVLHELLHGAGWSLFTTNGWRSISFGVSWKSLAPYAHCKDAVSKNGYIIGTLLPGAVLGLIPFGIGLLMKHDWLFWYGTFFTAGAAGDVLSVVKMREVEKHQFIIDHQEHLGFIVVQERK